MQIKICGISEDTALEAAVSGGASHIGLVFYPRSPRHVTKDKAKALSKAAERRISRVGLFVDPDDRALEDVLKSVPLEMIQLHGGESAARVSEVRRLTGLPVMKACKIADQSDVEQAKPYFQVADIVLFDAKPPKDHPDALPGGNALSFDWTLIEGMGRHGPWALSGGLTPDNVLEAIAATGADFVDVSSGVEDAPGRKSPEKIAAFIAAAKKAG
ncbi:MAG: phosphoribosylanthranilate isomerase [Alphaproteobacteria bacterium]|nr:phosphoribosylanthranilate isomerase [Alphaproteobacteria bacterium]